MNLIDYIAYHGNGPTTGDNSHTFEYALIMLCSDTGATLSAYLLRIDLKKQKALELTRKLK
jgi:phosphopentomutase